MLSLPQLEREESHKLSINNRRIYPSSAITLWNIEIFSFCIRLQISRERERNNNPENIQRYRFVRLKMARAFFSFCISIPTFDIQRLLITRDRLFLKCWNCELIVGERGMLSWTPPPLPLPSSALNFMAECRKRSRGIAIILDGTAAWKR